MIPIGRELADLGFALCATEGTREALAGGGRRGGARLQGQRGQPERRRPHGGGGDPARHQHAARQGVALRRGRDPRGGAAPVDPVPDDALGGRPRPSRGSAPARRRRPGSRRCRSTTADERASPAARVNEPPARRPGGSRGSRAPRGDGRRILRRSSRRVSAGIARPAAAARSSRWRSPRRRPGIPARGLARSHSSSRSRASADRRVRRRRRHRLADPALRGLRGRLDVPVPLRLRERARPVARRTGACAPCSAVWIARGARSRSCAPARSGRSSRGLRLRAVNVEGLLDAARDPDSLLSLRRSRSGAAFFFILRRSGAAARRARPARRARRLRPSRAPAPSPSGSGFAPGRRALSGR